MPMVRPPSQVQSCVAQDQPSVAMASPPVQYRRSCIPARGSATQHGAVGNRIVDDIADARDRRSPHRGNTASRRPQRRWKTLHHRAAAASGIQRAGYRAAHLVRIQPRGSSATRGHPSRSRCRRVAGIRSHRPRNWLPALPPLPCSSTHAFLVCPGWKQGMRQVAAVAADFPPPHAGASRRDGEQASTQRQRQALRTRPAAIKAIPVLRPATCAAGASADCSFIRLQVAAGMLFHGPDRFHQPAGQRRGSLAACDIARGVTASLPGSDLPSTLSADRCSRAQRAQAQLRLDVRGTSGCARGPAARTGSHGPGSSAVALAARCAAAPSSPPPTRSAPHGTAAADAGTHRRPAPHQRR